MILHVCIYIFKVGYTHLLHVNGNHHNNAVLPTFSLKYSKTISKHKYIRKLGIYACIDRYVSHESIESSSKLIGLALAVGQHDLYIAGGLASESIADMAL